MKVHPLQDFFHFFLIEPLLFAMVEILEIFFHLKHKMKTVIKNDAVF